MEWRSVKPVRKEKIKEVEDSLQWKFPEDFSNDIPKINCGRPNPELFLTKKGIERVFDAMFNFEEGTLNILSMNKYFKNDKLVAFASDPFGNFICFHKEDNKIYFWNHETDELDEITNSWSEFLKLLY